MKIELEIDENILKQFEYFLQEKLGIFDDLNNLWKRAMYDHRAYKLLPISSILYGDSEHDLKLRNAFIHVLERYEKYGEIRDYFISNYVWEDQPNYFNYKYTNDTAGMLYGFLYYRKYEMYYNIKWEELENEINLLSYVKSAISLQKPEQIIGIYILLRNGYLLKNSYSFDLSIYKDKIKVMNELNNLTEFQLYNRELETIYEEVLIYIKGDD